MSGATVARELCKQTSLLLQYRHCAPRVPLCTGAVQTCGGPAGHWLHCHTALTALYGLTVDRSQMHVFIDVPLLLQLRSQHADLW